MTRPSGVSRKIKTTDDAQQAENAENNRKSFINIFRHSVTTEPRIDKDIKVEVLKQTEGGDKGRLHDIYTGMFREWIKKEAKDSSRYKSPTIRYVEFDKCVKLSSWHSFKESSWPDIKNKIEESWSKLNNDEVKERCKVFYKTENDQYLPASFLDMQDTRPGQYHEMAIFMRDYDDWARCTNRQPESSSQLIQRQNSNPNVKFLFHRKYAKFQHGDSQSLTRQACALLCLEQTDKNKSILRLYSYNISNGLFDAISNAIKESLQSQSVRYEFLISTMKLKLGLCHELHHRHPLDVPMDYLATPSVAEIPIARKTKTRKNIELDDIISNKVVTSSTSKRFCLSPFIRMFQDGCDSIPRVNLFANGAIDPVRSHAEQFKKVKTRVKIHFTS